MRFRLRLAIGAALLTSVATGASALPLGPVAALQNGSVVTLVRDGCGPYGHRSHYGYCKQNGDEDGGEGYGRPRYAPQRFYEEDRYERRCFIRETEYGPRRICR